MVLKCTASAMAAMMGAATIGLGSLVLREVKSLVSMWIICGNITGQEKNMMYGHM